VRENKYAFMRVDKDSLQITDFEISEGISKKNKNNWHSKRVLGKYGF
jgi:hypothetical protein